MIDTIIINIKLLFEIGRRMKNSISPVPLIQLCQVALESCKLLYKDNQTAILLQQKFYLMIIDGQYPECALGIQYKLGLPFMFLNTVGFHTLAVTSGGSSAPFSITPSFMFEMTDDMSFFQRVKNVAVTLSFQIIHRVSNISLIYCILGLKGLKTNYNIHILIFSRYL